MIARQWRCIAVSNENVGHYLEHFQHGVLPELRTLNGFVEARILQRTLDAEIELTVITFWESMDAIRGFAGENVETAVVAPAAQAVLKSFDPTVIHYDVVVKV